jgi:hypothetical protein
VSETLVPAWSAWQSWSAAAPVQVTGAPREPEIVTDVYVPVRPERKTFQSLHWAAVVRKRLWNVVEYRGSAHVP